MARNFIGYKENLAAGGAPGVNDDISLGYDVGSRWINGSDVYICKDSTNGAAVWLLVNGATGAFQITAGGAAAADNISDTRTVPGNNSIDPTKDGQFNAGVDTGLGTANDYATIGGGLDNEAAGISSTVPGGEENKASTDYSTAGGRLSQTRNKAEQSYAGQQYANSMFCQERVVHLHQEIVPPAGDLPMYTDELAGGTEQIAILTDHSYAVAAVVLGRCVDIGGTPAFTAAWKIEGVFEDVGGTFAQIGVTITTPLANDDAVRFDTAPIFGVAGNKIQIIAAEDGNGVDTIRWMARVVLVELGFPTTVV